jgi:phage FluMu gp28-like protein
VSSEIEALPETLLPYQQALLAATRAHDVVVVEKSRRIGATWAIGADAVLRAAAERKAGGSDVFYVGYNLDMTREFVETCAMWARAFVRAAVEVEEFLFRDTPERDIQAFRVRFASGYEIVALPSRPRSLRGKQGYVIIDEGAFHDDLGEMLKAALALLIWGGGLLVISTHDGVDNAFNQLIDECRAGKKPYHVLRTTFEDAVADGLFRRVCLTTGREWSPEAEREWVEYIRRFYGDDAAEELDCIPSEGGGKYLPRALLEARTAPAPVLRWTLPDNFVDASEETRVATCREWLEEHVAPVLAGLPTHCRSFLGEDFGRSGDLTCLWPLLVDPQLVRHTPLVIELRNVPFQQQQQVVDYLCERLPRFAGAAFDARGNGQYLAEVTRQRWGSEMISEVMLTEGWYREHMPPMKAALEDGTLWIVADASVIDDFRVLEMVGGVARVARHTRDRDGQQRHGDSAIACALAYCASRTIDAGPITYAVAGRRTSVDVYRGDWDLLRPPKY